MSQYELDQYLDQIDREYEDYLEGQEIKRDEEAIEKAIQEVKKMSHDKYKVDPSAWEGKLSEMESSDGIYVFPQVGKTRLRLLVSPELEPTDFYSVVIRLFKGKTNTRYMMPVLQYVGDSWSEVKYLVTAKTVMQGILNILAGGEYDLIHPEKGHGIIINRTGEGLNTQYNVIPSKNPIPVDYTVLEFEHSLKERVRELEAADREEEMPL